MKFGDIRIRRSPIFLWSPCYKRHGALMSQVEEQHTAGSWEGHFIYVAHVVKFPGARAINAVRENLLPPDLEYHPPL